MKRFTNAILEISIWCLLLFIAPIHTYAQSRTSSTIPQRSLTIQQIPELKTVPVLSNLNQAFNSFNVESVPDDIRELYGEAKSDLIKLDSLRNNDARLPKMILWGLDQDADLLREYQKTKDSSFARAALTHVRHIANVNVQAAEVQVTAHTVNARGRRKRGYEICYTYAEWADLANPPILTFPNPSSSSELLPQADYVFWSRSFQDANKEGPKTPKKIEADTRDISMGIPTS
jgi:hypothetical protein